MPEPQTGAAVQPTQVMHQTSTWAGPQPLAPADCRANNTQGSPADANARVWEIDTVGFCVGYALGMHSVVRPKKQGLCVHDRGDAADERIEMALKHEPNATRS
jgi:hypothetical protein